MLLLGGEVGSLGYKHTEKAKEKIAQASRQRKGRKLTSIHRKNISKSLMGNTRRLGKPCTEAQRQKISKSLRGKAAWNKKKVVQMTLNGAIIRIWESVDKAQKDLTLEILVAQHEIKTIENRPAALNGGMLMTDWKDKAAQVFPEEYREFKSLVGRRPDAVEFTTIENDVKRRDLTINALFYDISKQEIVDYVGGIEDLRQGKIRAVGNATERFDEDRLRILRAIRFAARMGAGLDNETEEAILKDNSLQGVSPERIRDEFLKSVKSAKSVRALLRLYDGFNLWKQVFPGLQINTWYQETNNVPVLLALLLRDNPPKALGKKLNKLKYSAVETKQVMFLVMLQELTPENAMQLKKLWASTGLSDKDLEEFAILSGNLSRKLVQAFNKYQPSVKGQDLLAQGFKGRELGQEQQRLETELFKKLL